MNERIKKLAVESGIVVEEPGNGFDMTRLMPREVRFAELIVNECIKIVENSELELHYDNGMYPVTLTVNDIKERFGIK